MSGYYVYRLTDDAGTVLYVGCSNDPMGRLRRHRKRPWGHQVADMTISPFDTEATAREYERRLIDRLRPEHNVQLNPDSTGQVQRGERKDLVIAAIMEAGPLTQTQCEEHLRAQGIDGVKSFVGTTLGRLREAGVLAKVGEVPSINGRWATAAVYGIADEAAA